MRCLSESASDPANQTPCRRPADALPCSNRENTRTRVGTKAGFLTRILPPGPFPSAAADSGTKCLSDSAKETPLTGERTQRRDRHGFSPCSRLCIFSRTQAAEPYTNSYSFQRTNATLSDIADFAIKKSCGLQKQQDWSNSLWKPQLSKLVEKRVDQLDGRFDAD